MASKSLIGAGQLIVILRHSLKATDGSEAGGKTQETPRGVDLEGVRPGESGQERTC